MARSHKRRPDLARLAEHLAALRTDWEGRRLDSDPLAIPHRYAHPADREVVAFLASSLAFGRVAHIQASVERVLSALGPRPADAITQGRPLTSALPDVVHRWVKRRDLEGFLRAVGATLRAEGSLGNLLAAHDEGGPDFVPALDAFYRELRSRTATTAVSQGLRFLLPAPADGSACKRAHLFLRWMVRDADVDLGLWRGGRFAASRLLLPMDTHVHRISSYLGLTGRRAPDLEASREATGWLSKLCPEDPVSYDWALSRLGILAVCVREKGLRHCERCAVRPVCRVARRPAAGAFGGGAPPPKSPGVRDVGSPVAAAGRSERGAHP